MTVMFHTITNGLTMIKKLFKKITGISKIEQQIAIAQQQAEQAAEEAERARIAAAEANAQAEQAKKEEEFAKLSPKERATAKGEPYVAVLETHINKDNLRNGFLELDWNDEFVLQLKQAGYGYDGDPDEEVVDRWFRSLCSDVANESGIVAPERAGYINVKKLQDNKSEIS